ncbi:hypothetical protein PBI_MIMI_181 [Arthrobacter phage Mimi]|nr:hypothetical protein PBI_MIMI_261 [Arthrobacter phage Mimi]
MKKIILAVTAAAALALTGCGAANNGYAPNGGYSDWDWDLNRSSSYNNQTYCKGGVYKPLPGNRYQCTIKGRTSAPAARPKLIVPPKSQQKAPVVKQNSNPAPPKKSSSSGWGWGGSKSSSKSSSSGSRKK